MNGRGVRPARAVVRAVAAVLLLAAVGVSTAPTATAAVRQDQTTTTAPERPGIIPEPNSGVEPEDPGDRGGALQTALFVAMILGVVGIGGLVYRESRKARERRGF